jgi:hypothetical protein
MSPGNLTIYQSANLRMPKQKAQRDVSALGFLIQ